MTLFLGIAGKKESGKDTVAAYILSEWGRDPYGLQITVQHFADAIKTITEEFFFVPFYAKKDQEIPHLLWDNLPMEDRMKASTEIYSDVTVPHIMPGGMPGGMLVGLKTGPMTARQVWQYVGSSFRRLYPKVFVDHLLRKDFQYEDIVIIADVRYLNEVEAIRARGGKVIHIKRAAADVDPHESENSLDGLEPDYTIENNASHMALYRSVDKIMEQLEDSDCF